MRYVWLFAAMAMVATDGYGSDYGTTGLIDIPTARMAADGTLTTTAAIESRTSAYALTYQATPWLEGTFRYTGFNDFFYYDRNYEAKVRLLQEQGYVPQVAVGIRDMVGTGVYGAEYVVASKSFGNLDVTAGIGWGRLAGKGVVANPLKYVASHFESRQFDFGKGGTVSYEQFFSGPEIGFFGGASYQFETLPIKVIAEYNPDQYSYEIGQGAPAPESPFSFAVKWQPAPNVALALSRQHNDQWGFNLSLNTNSFTLPPKPGMQNFKSSLDMTRSEMPADLSYDDWYHKLFYDMKRSGLILVEAQIDEAAKTANLVIGNKEYAVWADAIAKAMALVNVHLWSGIQRINLVLEDNGHRVQTITYLRPAAQALPVVRRSLDKEALARGIAILPGRALQGPRRDTKYVTGKVNFDLSLSNRLSLFDPDDPALYQLYLKVGAFLVLPQSWTVRGSYGLDLYNNFDNSTRTSDSILPHVRSDVARYLKEGSTGLDSLFLERRGTWHRGLHYRVFGGVLEEMYSGAGGEVLYQPHQSRLAFGASANWVKQRAYDKGLEHLPYQTITGFVSAYWATPFYNYDAALHVGRYLAKDVGATLEVRRTFDNGWMVGLWATLTDVPFDDFGEGSFDKGMFFRIPLDGLFGASTRAAYTNRLRPIQRDGGQRLEDFSGNIWFDLRSTRYDALDNQRLRMVP